MSEKMQDGMDDFEVRLSKAMQRVEAPGTLATFLERAAEVERERSLPRRERKHKWAWYLPHANAWLGGAVAAMVVLGGFVGERAHVKRQRETLETQQFETATRITDKALERTREQLQRAGVPLE